MSLRKVGKFYWLDIRIHGKRIRRSLHTDNKFVALDRYKEKKDELLAEYAGKKVRFSDFCEKYLEWAWSSKPDSAEREEQRLRKIREFFESLDFKFLEDITPYHIEQLKAKLKKDGISIKGKQIRLAKSTINQYINLIKRVFNQAADWEVYEGRNPAKKVRLYRLDTHREALSATNLRKVMEEARRISENPRSPLQKCFYDLMVLAANTGMRKSEILNLKWRDVKEGEILIKGKGEKRRVVPLNEAALGAIERQPRREAYVFDIPNRDRSDVLKRSTDRIKKKTGINFTFHILRHTFTTMLLEKGVDLVTIGTILGHSRITMSLIYSHTSKEKMKKAVDLLI